MVELIVNEQLTRHTFTEAVGPLPAGTVNPVWERMLELSLRGYTARIEGDKATITGEENFSFVTGAWIATVCGTDPGQYQQELLWFPTWAKVPVASLSNQVPAFFLKPYVLDAEGQPTATLKTLAQWSPEYRVDGTNTNAYVELNGGGRPEPGSTVARVINAGYTILNTDQVQAELS